MGVKQGPRSVMHLRNGVRCARRKRNGLKCGTSARWYIAGVGESCTACLGAHMEQENAVAFQVTRIAPKGVKATSVMETL